MEYKFTPWKHQLDAIETAKNRTNYGLLFEQGTGKTATAIAIRGHWEEKEQLLLKTLVLGPTIVIENWKDEFLRFSDIRAKNIHTLTGPIKKREKLIETRCFDESGDGLPAVLITNYEAIIKPSFLNLLMKWQPDCLILDESHKIKSPNSKRTNSAIRLADCCKYKLILTGTPILNTPMDIFTQFRALDGGKAFSKNFFVFRETYFRDRNRGMPKQKYFPDWVPKENCFEDLSKKIAHSSKIVKKKDCLDLPPLVRQVVPTSMSPDQRKAYLDMKNDFVAHLNSGQTAIAELTLTKGLRLQQIVSGFVTTDDGETVEFSKNPRADALKELLEIIAVENKVIVWAVFKQNYKVIRKVCDDLGLQFVEVHGEVPTKQKFKNVEQFNEDPKTKIFIGHPLSAGIGINLIPASTSIVFSRSYSLEEELQSIARNYRGGSEKFHKKVTRIDLVTPDTIDELVLEALTKKQSISNRTLQEWKNLI